MARILLLAALVAGCWLLPTGISREQAIAIARRKLAMTNHVLVAASELVRPELDRSVKDPPPDPDGRVWVVTFDGTIEVCRLLGACQLRRGQTTVYLDHANGEVLMSATSG